MTGKVDGTAQHSAADTPPPGRQVAVLGAGPAGLSAALELTRRGRQVILFEQAEVVGGIARTVAYKGFRFDIGGHRFFTKEPAIQELWSSLLGNDLLVRPRLSRILYAGRFFDYPLRPLNTLRNLGTAESVRILSSYLRSKIFPVFPEETLADWIINRFGRRLYEIFFRSYTEKVWGVPCSAIKAQWAAQRIRGLSLRSTVFTMLFPSRNRKGIRTLIDRFQYPRLGPGMMWDRMVDLIRQQGGEVAVSTAVTSIRHEGDRVTAVGVAAGNVRELHAVDQVISSMPLAVLAEQFDPPAPPEVLDAARRLRYRDFITVAVMIDAPDLFPDNWLYINTPRVRVGRIQNFKNWSPEMVPDPDCTCLGLEYFCFRGDDLWEMPDSGLVALARSELAELGLADPALVTDGAVVRMPRAYPVYDGGYAAALAIVRAFLGRFTNLQVIGRNGMHRYNNMDHSMLTGIMAAANLDGERHDLWSVNCSGEYAEEQ